VLVCLGVCVYADHVRRSRRKRRRAVALAAGEIRNAEATRTLGDPLVHGQVAPVPIVLLGDVREGALAGERKWRHAFGLVFLEILQLGRRG
jgi:hypothetical protein